MNNKCILSPRIKKRKGEKTKLYLENRLQYFNNNIKNSYLTLFNKEIKFVFCDDIDENRCFEKFVYGGKKYHQTKTNRKPNPDMARAERLNWIIDIIQNYNICNNCNLNVTIEPKKVLLYCQKNRYLIVLKDLSSHYLLISAYTTYKNNSKNKIYTK